MQECTHTLTLSYTVSHICRESHTSPPLIHNDTQIHSHCTYTQSLILSRDLYTSTYKHTHVHTHTHTDSTIQHAQLYTHRFTHTHTHFHKHLVFCVRGSSPGLDPGFPHLLLLCLQSPSFLTHLEKRPIPNPLLWRRAGRVIAFI